MYNNTKLLSMLRVSQMFLRMLMVLRQEEEVKYNVVTVLFPLLTPVRCALAGCLLTQ